MLLYYKHFLEESHTVLLLLIFGGNIIIQAMIPMASLFTENINSSVIVMSHDSYLQCANYT